MCGLVGMLTDRWTPQDFAAALACIAHRGPDDQGVWSADACGPGDPWKVHLGHRRLAIIDLSPAGHQPMSTVDPPGRFTIVFNGEIYNFQELRRELEQGGIRFRGHSDTEVLLNGFARWGGKALAPRLDGMFAFAVWDAQERTLFAARDRFGVKPLYYANGRAAGGLVFASTLDPFWKLPGFPRAVSHAALRDYFASDFIPAPMTILREVRALLPAHWLTYDARSHALETGRFWDIPSPVATPMPLAALVDATDDALRRSLRRQLVADVPLGAFLSGGIDSSLMVHYMHEAGAGPLRTFTVGFPEHGKYDESPIAAAVAAKYGAEHHNLHASAINGDDLAAGLAHLDQPLADPAYLTTLSISALTRKQVTVAISGDGGDELFGGYGRYLRTEASYAGGGMKPLRRLVERGLLPASLAGRTLTGREAMLWDRVRFGPWPRSRKSLARLLTNPVWAEPADTMEFWNDLLDRFAAGRQVDSDALMRADLWTYLSDNCLQKTDRASMCVALEVRVPMLGNEVVDLVLPQPASVKLEGGLKAVLTVLAKRYLPREVWDRPKHGFSVPLASQFAGPWRARCEAWVHDAARLAPFLRANEVQRRWSMALRGKGDLRAMYSIVTLLGWLEAHPVDA